MSKSCGTAAGCGAVYGLGFLGAVVYHFQQASSIGQGLWGFVQAIFWPGFVVHDLLTFLNR